MKICKDVTLPLVGRACIVRHCLRWVLLFSNGIALPLNAQITPDGTTDTSITPTDNGVRIDEGDRAGDNLFHSFEQFSVTNGSEAFFNNANDIVNIFSRVTGGDISNIDGLIRANGSANLFLINPAGIVFGEGASLNIGGSFFASTAESIVFSDDVEFSAIDRGNAPLLTVNMPIGLNFGNNSGDIAVNGSNLRVNNRETLALVGGNVTITGGQIIAPGANINLGGLIAAGQIGFDSFSFPEAIARGDVTLTDGAEVNVQAAGGGSIRVNARNLELSGGESGASILRAGIASESESIKAQAGDIRLNATDYITLNQASSIDNRVEESGVGNAGEIGIDTNSIEVTDGAVIDASTFGRGGAGAVNITATDKVSLHNDSYVFSRVNGDAAGNSGGVTVTTGSLNLTNGGQINADTFGRGNGADIIINARDSVNISGVGSYASGLFSNNAGDQAEGDAGNININTNFLKVTDGAIIDANSRGWGNGGNININTDSLEVKDRAIIDASTFGRGDAGAVNITATDKVSLHNDSYIFSRVYHNAKGNSNDVTVTTDTLNLTDGGQINADTFGRGNGGDTIVNAQDSVNISGVGSYASGLYANALDGSGNGGNIIIATDKLIVQDKAVVTVGNFFDQGVEGSFFLHLPSPPGTGAAGNLEIQAGSVEVSDRGKITADNANGIGGNLTLNADSLTLENDASVSASTTAEEGLGGIVTLNVNDRLIMSDRSSISARADSGANGGNLTINTESIVAFPNQNNDIIASAERGNGGNIDITTNGIFGIAERSSIPPNNTNDLDASSEFGLDGTISINELDVNPTEGLEELPIEIINVARLIEDNLCQQGDSSEFIVTGKGGIAPNPSQARDSEVSEVDLVEPANHQTERRGERQFAHETTSLHVADVPKEKIVEAQGWIVNDRGTVELVTYQTNHYDSPPQPKNSKSCN